MNNKTRKAMKSIVKECLLEILAEGLVGNNVATLSEARELRGTLHEAYENSTPSTRTRNISESSLSNYSTQVTSARKPSPSRKPSYLDSIKMGVDNAAQNNRNNAIAKTVQGITDDPIMSDIFADTAATTLREQKEGSRPSGPAVSAQGDHAAKVVDQALPEELFGSASNKWANLAFAPSIRNR